jgi:glycosyltransferase involved in cell wall biosynthesis
LKYKILSLLNDHWYLHGRPLVAIIIYFFAKIFWIFGIKNKARSCCCASLRYGASGSAARLLKEIITQYPYTEVQATKGVSLAEAAGRSIVVKWPEIENGVCNKKGILIITFTRTFSFYLRCIKLRRLEEYFYIVLEPSWSGYADPDILAFIGRVEKVIVQASELQDRALLNGFPETFVACSFGASDWVDYNRFSPSECEKMYDSVYVANTNPLKRIKRYLDAIKSIVNSGHSDYVGYLVCSSWGGAEKLVSKIVESYGLKANVRLAFDLSTEQVVQALNESKVNILLSYKEGSNRSLFESIFCNVPVICLYENVGVNKAYINEHTGALIFDSMLEETLVWMRTGYNNFSPRRWAVNNISPSVTNNKLSEILSSSFSCSYSQNEIFIKTNNPEVRYLEFSHIKPIDYSAPILEMFMNDRSDYAEQLGYFCDGFNESVKNGL